MTDKQKVKDLPLVSVIIPAYNAEEFIERTLNSVLTQTYQNLEVLVINDGSQDKTVDKVQEMAKQDARIYLFQQTNLGVAAARNLGIEKARGEFIAPIDADDVWCPQNLEKHVNCLLNSDLSIGLTYAWSVDIDEKENFNGEFRASTIDGQVYTILLLHDFIANASSTMIRRSCLDKVGGYNCELKKQNAQGCEDWELYLRIAEHYEFRVIPEFLVGYRKLFNSMSSNVESMAKSRLAIWQSIFDKYPKIPKVIYRLSMSSFYMYLARQSSRYGKQQEAFLCLYQAIKTGWITPFMRPDFYILFIKYVRALTFLKNSKFHMLNFKPLTDDEYTIYSGEGQNFQIPVNIQANNSFKLLAERLMSKIIPVVFGSSDSWQN